jgi:hypothetical protein
VSIVLWLANIYTIGLFLKILPHRRRLNPQNHATLQDFQPVNSVYADQVWVCLPALVTKASRYNKLSFRSLKSVLFWSEFQTPVSPSVQIRQGWWDIRLDDVFTAYFSPGWLSKLADFGLTGICNIG